MKTWWRLILLALSLLPLTGVGAEDWVLRGDVKSASGNLAFPVHWDPAIGLHLRIARKSPAAVLQLAINPRAATARVSIGSNGIPEQLDERIPFQPEALPTGPPAETELLLKFRLEAWTLYLDHRPVVTLPTPFPLPTEVTQLKSEWTNVSRAAASWQKVEDFYFHDDFMVDTNEENVLGEWEIQSGDWSLHTALDDAKAQKSSKKLEQRPLKADYSPNFYSVAGESTGATPAIMVSGYPFYDQYTTEAALLLHPGEMGLVFYFEDPTNYYAFTLAMDQDIARPTLLTLWRRSSPQGAARQILAAATTPLTPDQWVQPRVVVSHHRIQCYLDSALVFDVRANLPPGGRFGLLMNSGEEVRFDDVQAKSLRDLDLGDTAAVRFYAQEEHGAFFPRGWRTLFQQAPANHLQPTTSAQPQWLVLGHPAHPGHVFAAQFEPRGKEYTVGLLSGRTTSDQPYWRFILQRSTTAELFRLEKVVKDAATLVESLRLPVSSAVARTPVTLMADATEEKILRLYRDGKMVLLHQNPEAVTGASGLFLGPDTAVAISNLVYRFERSDVFRNRYEKNRLYAQDPFMRNWSSPEGEWFEDRDKLMWHKSDFFGRFDLNLPFVAKTEVHLGIPENQTNGALVVTIDTNAITVLDGIRDSARVHPLARVPTPTAPRSDKEPVLHISYADHWLWVNMGTNELFKLAVPQPLRGTRMRVAGFTRDHLAHCFADRYNVKDYLFTEAPCEWVVNGGRWQIINRFQCDPRWSHMNGESKDGLAALWTKFRFRGDFCAEMYAGIRHGWYERCGDLNLTVMASQPAPSLGYTVTCTGWDQDQSQMYTRLFRNGQVLALSDKYLIPRWREGNKRVYIEPVVNPSASRDVHGAWYYIKLRRIGSRLEYYFDNELVFRQEDSQPLTEGQAGIWTFMNSMVLARVKIAASEIRPGPLALTPVEPGRVSALRRPIAPDSDYGPKICNGTNPVNTLRPACWQADDDVGYPSLGWTRDEAEGDYFVLQNTLGGGTLLARCRLAPVPYTELAGWRFYVKRTDQSQFNFHYSLGQLNVSNQYVATRKYFHRISGSDFSRGEFKMSGQTQVPGIATGKAPWHTTGTWTPVDVWLPTEDYLAWDTSLLVRVEGFGNLQPGDETQGLAGNGPGQGYAVSMFQEIRYRPPALAIPDSKAPLAFQLLDFPTRLPTNRLPTVEVFQTWLTAAGTTGLQRCRFAALAGDRARLMELAWIQLPTNPVFTCSWSDREPNAVRFLSGLSYPDRRFAFAKVSAGGQDLPLLENTIQRKTAYLPRNTNLLTSATNSVVVTLRYRDFNRTYPLDRDKAGPPERPVLLKLDGALPFFENFEHRTFGPYLNADNNRMKICHDDPVQGSYVEVANRFRGQRLHTAFSGPLSLSAYPLLQFRYRADTMDSLTLALGDAWYVRLSDEYPAARNVPFAGTLLRDHAWHTWLGQVSDAVSSTALNRRQYCISRFTVASFNNIDQTGAYSQWWMDDLIFGPAVSAAGQLAVKPVYFDADGVKSVAYAVRPGPQAFAELNVTQRQEIVWRTVPGDAPVCPDLAGLADGVAHLLLKAEDRGGLESAVTDIPFLLDRKPPTAAAALEASDSPFSNGSLLRTRFVVGEGSPLALEDLKLSWNGKTTEPDDFLSQLSSAPTETSLLLNWPYLFRKELDRMSDGDRATIAVTNLHDGAGNQSPDLEMPVKIDYASDHTGPAWLPAKFPSNILVTTSWEGLPRKPTYFELVKGSNLCVQYQRGEEPYLALNTANNESAMQLRFTTPRWSMTNHPYLSLRLRRPVIATNEHSCIELALETTNKFTWILPLNYAATGTNILALPEAIRWESNTWQTIALNVCELLEARTNATAAAQQTMVTLTLRCTNSMEKLSLHLQNLFIYSDWRPSNRLILEAYDLSGVAGLAWEYANDFASMEVAPDMLRPGRMNNGWFLVRARDKAGNLSTPLRIPAAILAAGAENPALKLGK